MAYGTGGTTTGYNTHVVGTGGYCKITQESETPFEGYTEVKEINVCKLPSETLENVVKISNWTQPTLTANGTLGGDSFAVSANEYSTANSAYKAFDKSASTYWYNSTKGDAEYIIYNPNALCITNIAIQNRADGDGDNQITSGKVYASENGSNWVELVSYTNTVSTKGGTWYISLANNKTYYKYYKLFGTHASRYVGIAELGITATQKKIIDKQIKYYGII